MYNLTNALTAQGKTNWEQIIKVNANSDVGQPVAMSAEKSYNYVQMLGSNGRIGPEWYMNYDYSGGGGKAYNWFILMPQAEKEAKGYVDIIKYDSSVGHIVTIPATNPPQLNTTDFSLTKTGTINKVFDDGTFDEETEYTVRIKNSIGFKYYDIGNIYNDQYSTVGSATAQVSLKTTTNGYAKLSVTALRDDEGELEIDDTYTAALDYPIRKEFLKDADFNKFIIPYNKDQLTKTFTLTGKELNALSFDYKFDAAAPLGSGNGIYNVRVRPEYTTAVTTIMITTGGVDTAIESISIPDGQFYPGQTVPITVTYSQLVKSENGNNMTLNVNGTAVHPTDTNGNNTVYTYYYTVKDVDTGSVAISSAAFSANSVKGNNFLSTMQNYLNLTNGNAIAQIDGYSNSGCQIVSPERTKLLGSYQVGATDDLPGVQVAVGKIAINLPEGVGTTNWITASSKEVAVAKLTGIDGSTVKSSFRLTGMYASYDGGKTRYPVYIITKGQSEEPDYLLFNMQIPTNISNCVRKDTIELFLSNGIDYTTDYLTAGAAEKTDALGYKYYILYRRCEKPADTVRQGLYRLCYGRCDLL